MNDTNLAKTKDETLYKPQQERWVTGSPPPKLCPICKKNKKNIKVEFSSSNISFKHISQLNIILIQVNSI